MTRVFEMPDSKRAGGRTPSLCISRRPLPYGFIRTALCILALLAIGRPAAAQPPAPSGEGERSGPVMLANFGFNGAIPGDRWGPITVSVTAGDQTIAGAIIVEYVQDATQAARIAVPFAATPGLTTQVPIVASIPTMCDRVTFTMVNERGSPIHRMVYGRIATPTVAQMPAPVDPQHALIVMVGRGSLPECVRDWVGLYNVYTDYSTGVARTGSHAPRDAAWGRITAARVEADELPLSWIAYEGVQAIVVNPQSSGAVARSADPRALEAVHTWVRSGGRLVVLADGPGDAWRQWLPDEARGMVSLDAPGDGPLPPAVAAAVRRAAQITATRITADPENDSLRIDVPPPAERATQRVIRLTEAGREAGWTLRWVSDGAEDVDRGLIAEGPAGYGLITILGLDPSRAPATLSARAAGEVWRDALETALDYWLDQTESILQAQTTGGWGALVIPANQRANNAAVERVGQVPEAGEWLFLVIAGAMSILALLVGPVDYFVLRRLGAAQRSWLTALGWVALASAVAYGGPKVLRAQPTQVNRLTVVDAVVPNAPGGERLAFVSGFTGVYSGESGVVRFEDPDLTAWWRGTSLEYSWGGATDAAPGAIIPTRQAAAGGEAGSARGNPLVELPMPLWTFRAFNDTAIPAADSELSQVIARVTPTADGYDVFVAGLPREAVVTAAALRLADGWYTINPPAREMAEPPRPKAPAWQLEPPPPPPPMPNAPLGAMDAGVWSARFPAAHRAGGPDAFWETPLTYTDYTQYFMYNASSSVLDERPGPVLGALGADRRGAAVEQRVATGRWAAVYLNVVNLPSDVRVTWPSNTTHARVLRLLVPLEKGPS